LSVSLCVCRFEKYIEQLPGQNTFIPCGCGEVVDVAPLVPRHQYAGSHPFDRPEAPDTDCKTLTKEFREQLQDLIRQAKNKNVLVLSHRW
jgi:hypothetical protein